jgi:hypothetical protein
LLFTDSSTLGFIRRNLGRCPTNIKRQAYLSLVRPHLEYASSVWDPHLQKHLYQIEMVQRRAMVVMVWLPSGGLFCGRLVGVMFCAFLGVLEVPGLAGLMLLSQDLLNIRAWLTALPFFVPRSAEAQLLCKDHQRLEWSSTGHSRNWWLWGIQDQPHSPQKPVKSAR